MLLSYTPLCQTIVPPDAPQVGGGNFCFDTRGPIHYQYNPVLRPCYKYDYAQSGMVGDLTWNTSFY